MISRRNFIGSGGLLLACLTAPQIVLGKYRMKDKTHIIKMDSDEDGSRVWFDPVGLFVRPGAKIRFVVHHNTHTVAAYHPDNDGHSLRIPQKAKSWNSDYLVEPGEQFEVTLEVPGVYDYYCLPHESSGMVGRIVVGEISGPGAKPFDYFKKLTPPPNWQDVPAAAQCALPAPELIIRDKIIPFQLNDMVQKCRL